MKILITGGCGFLGSNLALEALKRGDELIIFDNLNRMGSEFNLTWLKQKGTFTFVHGDIRNWNDVSNVIKKATPDILFHLAGQVAMTTSIENPRMDFEVNTLGTFNVLEAVRHLSPESVVAYSSTNKVYGDLEQYSYFETDTRYKCKEKVEGFDEETLLSFHSPYGCSKGAADQYMLDYARIFGLKTVVFRHSSMYGGRQYATYDQGWIGWFCQKGIEIKNGIIKEPLTISGNGKQVRDLLYSQDMVRLYYSIIDKIGSVKGMVFNIGGGMENSLSLIELFNCLETMLDIKILYTKLPVRVSDQRVFVADIKKAKKYLGWEPKTNYQIGLKNMIEWTSTVLKHS